MKKFITLVTILFAALYFVNPARLSVGKDKIVKVNNHVITEKELNDKYNLVAKYFPEGQKPSKKDFLQEIITKTLLLDEIKKLKNIILNQEQFKQLLNQQKYIYTQSKLQENPAYKFTEDDFKLFLENEAGMTYEKFEDLIKDNVLIEQFISKKIESKVAALRNKTYESKSDFPIEIINRNGKPEKYYSLKDFYDRNLTEFNVPKHVIVKHIAKSILYNDGQGLKRKPQAEIERIKKSMEDIHSRLMKGESFDKLCEMYSEDEYSRDYKDKDGKYNRGLIEFPIFISGMYAEQQKQLFGEDVFNKLFTYQKGKYSPVLVGKQAVHIFYIVDKKDGQLAPFEEVKPQIIQQFQMYEYQVMKQKELEKIVDELKSKASIVYYKNEYK